MVDMILPDYMITPSLSEATEGCSPYGQHWDEPVFLTELTIGSIFTMGGTMAKVRFKRKNKTEIEATHFFNIKSEIGVHNIKEELRPGTKVIVALSTLIESYQNSYNNSLFIVDIKKA